ncbi:30S ribosomal protein S5 [Candidatus Falkowbacteria bacterium CG10_big_fil_rev_8_21_14_0_10_43_10]|uniref:Small ribosomal subunit protein uS5 n=1 Tax=Candidatus Falkowbacteria bacterium CG10_big_fil_rev_8_21_14_0_10_43_10 TaxID=1974567 RepID=A0A2H0V2N0_9BACT|nr:MAG: 30S ribosomal protein S5 [Candidatus Falkowbacteria bacterium CG10_big_fil_rev_8_21_14_0_10_43_10]
MSEIKPTTKMVENKEENKATGQNGAKVASKPAEEKKEGEKRSPSASSYSREGSWNKKRKNDRRDRRGKDAQDEFEQKIVHIARVTRVMAGGKRMRFRACVAVGNRKGKVGIGLAKAADVTNAISKAVDQAKKNIVNVQILDGTIAHDINQKFGAARIMLKPAKQGTGTIAGGAVRVILELAGIKNVVGKIFGTNNPVNNVKCVMEGLRGLKFVEAKEKKEDNKIKKETKKSGKD